jgi:hypothetical protein
MRKYLSLCIAMLVLAGIQPVWGDEVKLGHSCGCATDSYATYGAGQDTCQTFLKEHAANPDSNQTDATFGQTLGWLAGYMSAANRGADTRDVYDMGLDYLTTLVADWCQENPEKILSDAMDAVTDSRSGTSGLLQ